MSYEKVDELYNPVGVDWSMVEEARIGYMQLMEEHDMPDTGALRDFMSEILRRTHPDEDSHAWSMNIFFSPPASRRRLIASPDADEEQVPNDEEDFVMGEADGEEFPRNDYKGYYQLLNVDYLADLRTIKTEYRRLSLKHHPDKNPGDAEAAMPMFIKIKHAYDVLRHEE